MQVSDDRRAVKLTLPAPKLTEPRLDPDRTRVYDRDRGVLDRVEDALSDRPGDEQPLYQLAEDKLAAAAAADPELLRDRGAQHAGDARGAAARPRLRARHDRVPPRAEV